MPLSKVLRRDPAPARTQQGQLPPTTRGGLADVLADVRHGAPRRPITDSLVAFSTTLPPAARVLEVGAGHYDHRSWFPGLVTLDFDPAHGPDVVGDAHAMPLEDDAFDAAVAVSVLEHVDDPFQVVRELHRVLRPGARVFAWVPFYFHQHGFPGDVSRFTEEGLRGCFERAGFVVEHSDAMRYAGLFHHLSNQVHFLMPRDSIQRWRRVANRVLTTLLRLGLPLDARLKVRTMYSGTELVAVKPPGG